ncbi:MAG: hypothetical protein R3C05_20180 [Pirellulaceae bacterium]
MRTFGSTKLSMRWGRWMELVDLLRKANRSVDVSETTQTFADSLGLDRGRNRIHLPHRSGSHPRIAINPKDFRKAVTTIIECGGDADLRQPRSSVASWAQCRAGRHPGRMARRHLGMAT